MLRLLQITDPHLFAQTHRVLCGVNTATSLTSVVSHIVANQLPVDAVLATGDIAQEPVADSYQLFVELTKPLNAPVHCIAGNHDESSSFATLHDIQQHCQFEPTHYVVKHQYWWIIMLNSSIAKHVEGRVENLDWLALTLQQAASQAKHVLIALHHNPLEVGCKWMDGYKVQNAEDLFAVIDQQAGVVKAIVHGHTHQDFSCTKGDITVWGTPSTCFQFFPKSDLYKLDNVAAGYRIITLADNGSVSSEVVRLDQAPEGLDMSNTGY